MREHPLISAIVPAAGMSTRMGGQNKLNMPFRGKALIRWIVDTLLNCDVGEVIVVLGYQAESIREALKDRNVKLIDNPAYREGMSTSIRAGVAAISADAAAILVCPADQPLLDPSEVSRIIAAFDKARAIGKSIVVPFFQGCRGNPVILDVRYKNAIFDVVGDVGYRQIIEKEPDQVFAVEMETDHVIRDVDTPEDYRMLGDPLRRNRWR